MKIKILIPQEIDVSEDRTCCTIHCMWFSNNLSSKGKYSCTLFNQRLSENGDNRADRIGSRCLKCLESWNQRSISY